MAAGADELGDEGVFVAFGIHGSEDGDGRHMQREWLRMGELRREKERAGMRGWFGKGKSENGGSERLERVGPTTHADSAVGHLAARHSPCERFVMRLSRFLSFVVLAFLCFLPIGCATYSEAELQQIARLRLPANVEARLHSDRPLQPEDVILLTRYRVPEHLIVRHLDDHEPEYLLGRDDMRRMRAAGVSVRIREMMMRASDEFVRDQVRRYYAPAYDPYYAYDPFYPYYPMYSGGLHWGIGTWF
jgi:hypothetical protein